MAQARTVRSSERRASDGPEPAGDETAGAGPGAGQAPCRRGPLRLPGTAVDDRRGQRIRPGVRHLAPLPRVLIDGLRARPDVATLPPGIAEEEDVEQAVIDVSMRDARSREGT